MNLKDRMKSDSNSSGQNGQSLQQGSERKQEDGNLKSMNDLVKKQEEMISKLSSQVLTLKNKVLVQKQEIVDLNEYIVKLSESDKQLKEAYSLKSAAEEAVATSSKLVSDYKEAHKERMAILDERENAINKKEARVNEIASDQEAEISKRVKKDVSKIESRLQRDYNDRKQLLERCDKEMVRAHLTGYITSIVGLILAALGILALSEPYQNEAEDFFKELANIICAIATGPYKAAIFFAGKMLSEAANPAGYWVIGILLMVIFYGILITLFILLCVFLCKKIKECMWDGITVDVFEFVMLVPIFFAPILVEIQINLLLLRWIIFIIYMIIRIYIAWDNEESKNEFTRYFLYIVFVVAGFCLIMYIAGHI